MTGGPLTGRTKTPPVFRRFDGLQPYEPIVTAMADHVAAIRQDGADEEVWLLEHAPVLTGGTSAQDSDLVDTSNIAVHRSGRGGQWTWHGPGQRIAYVMLDLSRRGQDVRALVHGLEGWITLALGNSALPACVVLACQVFGLIQAMGLAGLIKLPLLAYALAVG